MAEWLLKYADARGTIHEQVAEAATERELRERMSQQGFLVYSVKPRTALSAGLRRAPKKKLNVEKFLVFNEQFVTLVRAGLPILKCLDLLADRLTDAKLGPYIRGVRDEVRNGALLSDAFAAQGVFPKIYVTSILAGERSGALVETIERFVKYQRLALAVRKKLLLSLLYPSVLVFLVICLIVFLITYVVPNFAKLYESMQASLPKPTLILIVVGTTARDYVLVAFAALLAAGAGFRMWSGTSAGKEQLDRMKLRVPLFGRTWIKYQVAQFSRVLSTLLVGGIPLLQALATASESLGNILLERTLTQASERVKAGQPLSAALRETGIFPGLALDMMEVGESTGALPAMLNSVAEFYEDDVNTSVQATLSLIEPAVMVFMGVFVAFVLISLYLPIFSLGDAMNP
jgi:type IV pilus assembly protein PilC